MKKMRRLCARLGLLVACLAPGLPAAAQSFSGHSAGPVMTIVIDEEVVATFIRGELRWCERVRLDGRICRTGHSLFGVPQVQDWWDAQTYVHAKAGLANARIHEVGVLPGDGGLFIRFSGG